MKHLNNQNLILYNPNCQLCDDTGFIRHDTFVEMCKCQKIKVRKERLGEEFFGIELSSITPKSETQLKLLELLKVKPETSIYAYGPRRSGKTHFLSAMHNYWFDKSPLKVIYFTSKDLFDILREVEFKNNFDIIYSMVKDNKYFFIDDLGKSRVSDAIKEAFFAFINRIKIDKKYLFITSELPLDVLGSEDCYGGGTIRRIEDICGLVNLK